MRRRKRRRRRRGRGKMKGAARKGSVIWRWWRLEFSPESVHYPSTDYSHVFYCRCLLQRWRFTLKMSVFATFSPFPVIKAPLDAGGATNSGQFHFMTPLNDLLSRIHCKSLLQGWRFTWKIAVFPTSGHYSAIWRHLTPVAPQILASFTSWPL